MNPDCHVIFTRIEGVPHWTATHWRAELFDTAGDGWLSHPVAVAYVTESPSWAGGPSLDYLTVFDHHRGEGYVRPLVRAIHERWPDIWHTERIDKDGNFRSDSRELDINQ